MIFSFKYSKTSDIYSYKEIWPIKTAISYLGTNVLDKKSVRDEDLHVFIPNSEMMEVTIKQFIEMYSLRTKKSREYWLVDIGYWTGNGEDRDNFYRKIRHDLIDLQLDLDDDLYFFEGKTELDYYDMYLYIFLMYVICRK